MDDDERARLDLWRDARPASPEPRRFRARTARRSPGRTAFGVFGLLGVLVTVAILGILGSRVLASVAGRTTTDDEMEDLLGGGGSSVTTPTDAAAAGACDANLRTVESAAEAFRVLNGRPPVDQAELVPDFLAELVPDVAVRSEGEAVAVEGTGACASG